MKAKSKFRLEVEREEAARKARYDQAERIKKHTGATHAHPYMWTNSCQCWTKDRTIAEKGVKVFGGELETYKDDFIFYVPDAFLKDSE